MTVGSSAMVFSRASSLQEISALKNKPMKHAIMHQATLYLPEEIGYQKTD